MAYATAAEAKARQTRLTDYDDTLVDEAIAEFADIAERYCCRAFASHADATYEITERPLPVDVVLPGVNISDVSIDCDGTDVDLTESIILEESGVIGSIPWPDRYAESAVVTYTHGTESPPGAIKRAAIEYAARVLIGEGSGMSRDVRTQAFDGGTTSYVTPDWEAGRPTGFLEVDRLLNSYRLPLGFA